MHHQHHHKIFRTKSSLSCAFDADVSVDKHESAARQHDVKYPGYRLQDYPQWGSFVLRLPSMQCNVILLSLTGSTTAQAKFI